MTEGGEIKTMSDIVSFNVDGALYGIPVERVREILDQRKVSPMPGAPAYLMGIIDLRGENIPVVDLRKLLRLDAAEDTPNTRILVTLINKGSVQSVIGLRTDRVIEVAALDDNELRPMSDADLLQWNGITIAGIGRRNGDIISVIDIDNLFASASIDALAGPDTGTNAGAVSGADAASAAISSDIAAEA